MNTARSTAAPSHEYQPTIIESRLLIRTTCNTACISSGGTQTELAGVQNESARFC
jgi:hypothetical protein